MYYSAAEMQYVEMQRMKRILEAAREIDLIQDEEGIYRIRKDGENWEPDMSDLTRHGG